MWYLVNPFNQLISFVFKSICFLFLAMCSFQFNLQWKCSPRYFTASRIQNMSVIFRRISCKTFGINKMGMKSVIYLHCQLPYINCSSSLYNTEKINIIRLIRHCVTSFNTCWGINLHNLRKGRKNYQTVSIFLSPLKQVGSGLVVCSNTKNKHLRYAHTL